MSRNSLEADDDNEDWNPFFELRQLLVPKRSSRLMSKTEAKPVSRWDSFCVPMELI